MEGGYRTNQYYFFRRKKSIFFYKEKKIIHPFIDGIIYDSKKRYEEANMKPVKKPLKKGYFRL
jgi:hypothetical protein